MKNRIIAIVICVLSLGAFLIFYEGTTKNNHEEEPSTTQVLKATQYNKKATKKTKKKKSTKKKTTKKKSTKKKSSKLPNLYKLTHYGWDCKGCGGRTATGYSIKKTYYYNDKQYGKVRIVAMCSKMKLGSIIKIKKYSCSRYFC